MKKYYPLSLLCSIISIILCLSACDPKSPCTQLQARLDSVQQVLQSKIAAQQQLTQNKKLVADFYQQLFGDKNIAAIDLYIGSPYIQHNPGLPDGKEALKKAATQWFKGAPKTTIDVQHLSAEGNLVYLHSKSQMGGQTMAVLDIFRLKDHKIVEHWDVIQAVPEKAANAHPMF